MLEKRQKIQSGIYVQGSAVGDQVSPTYCRGRPGIMINKGTLAPG
jgi:hypothetical protein